MTKPTLEVKSGFSRLRVDLTYQGTNFSGWAKQPNERTVQEEVEKALSTIPQTKVATIVAGRTDAGVHAKHQVIHTDLPTQTDINNLAFRLNQILDADIRVLTAQWAPVNFHARFTAISRTYQYKIIDAGKVTAPLDRHDSTEWFRPLDIKLMNSGLNLPSPTQTAAPTKFLTMLYLKEFADISQITTSFSSRYQLNLNRFFMVLPPSRNLQKAKKSCSPRSNSEPEFINSISKGRNHSELSCLSRGAVTLPASIILY